MNNATAKLPIQTHGNSLLTCLYASEECEAPAVQEKRNDWLAGAVEIQQEDREIEAESEKYEFFKSDH